MNDVDQHPTEPHDPPSPYWITRSIGYFRRHVQERRAKYEKMEPADRAANSTANATWAIAILTVVTIIVGISQWVIFGRQLDVMENDKRPWLNAEITLQKYVRIIEWEGSRGIDLPLRFSLRNYGQEPAINVRVYPQVLPHPGNPRREELATPQKAICDGAPTQSDQNPIGGIAVFPTETGTIEIGSGISGRTIYKSGEPTLFALLGCVDYTYGNGKHGQTGFRYMIGKVTGGLVFGVPFVEGTPAEGYDVSEHDVKQGMPATPPKEARIPIGDLYFKPADSGNYAR